MRTIKHIKRPGKVKQMLAKLPRKAKRTNSAYINQYSHKVAKQLGFKRHLTVELEAKIRAYILNLSTAAHATFTREEIARKFEVLLPTLQPIIDDMARNQQIQMLRTNSTLFHPSKPIYFTDARYDGLRHDKQYRVGWSQLAP